jgi:hypothetical protein
MSTLPMGDELEQYRQNADALISARTEQLRTAITLKEMLAEALRSVSQANTLEAAKEIAEEAIRKVKMRAPKGSGR